MSKLQTSRLKWLALAAGGIGFLVTIVLPGGPIQHRWRQPSRAELGALRNEGDAVVRSLDEYFASHHRYPPELPASLDLSRGAKYGGWRYKCIAGCASFELFVGQYREFSFEIHWQPDKQNWYTDT